jgi:hypothetical protein
VVGSCGVLVSPRGFCFVLICSLVICCDLFSRALCNGTSTTIVLASAMFHIRGHCASHLNCVCHVGRALVGLQIESLYIYSCLSDQVTFQNLVLRLLDHAVSCASSISSAGSIPDMQAIMGCIYKIFVQANLKGNFSSSVGSAADRPFMMTASPCLTLYGALMTFTFQIYASYQQSLCLALPPLPAPGQYHSPRAAQSLHTAEGT